MMIDNHVDGNMEDSNNYIDNGRDDKDEQLQGYNTFQGFEALRNRLNGTYKQYFENIHAMTDSLTHSLTQFGEQLKQVIPDLSLQLSQIGNFLAPLEEVFSSIREQYASLAISLPPPMSEQEKESIKNAYIEWGNYGWTIVYWADNNFQSVSPGSRIEANRKALAHCKKSDLELLFSDLSTMRGIKKDDLDEAILDFNDRRYKSCAMILFSIIDARLIRLQRKEDMKGKQRDSGKSAAANIRKRIEKDHELNNTYLLLFSVESTFAAINSLFEKGADFRKQPDLLNRNFLDHGMLHRKVKRMDCIQVFLLLYNLFDLLDLVF